MFPSVRFLSPLPRRRAPEPRATSAGLPLARFRPTGGPLLPLALALLSAAGASNLPAQGSYTFSTLAGLISGQGSADGIGANAQFNAPGAIARDVAGNLYVADRANHTIRRITPSGAVTTLAGSPGVAGSTDDTGAAARFNVPSGIVVDGAGSLYVADTNNHTIRRVAPNGAVSTFAGLAGNPGSQDSTGSTARFRFPQGIAIDGAGNLVVADRVNHVLRRITPNGVVTTLAGNAGTPGAVDGIAAAARFNLPTGVAVDTAGNILVADFGNGTIRRVSPGGIVTTVAGLAGSRFSIDGAGNEARFIAPSGLGLDGSGNLHVVDEEAHNVRRVTPAGLVSTLAGAPGPFGTFGTAEGNGTAARFLLPAGVVVGAAGTLFIADVGNHAIRQVTAAGVVSTFAGRISGGDAVDGTGNAARFHRPSGIAVDSGGNLYVSDYLNHTIRRVAAGGVVTTLAGTPRVTGASDGPGAGARFDGPRGIAVDAGGNVFVIDSRNYTIRRVTTAGAVTTFAGQAGSSGSADGTGNAARFSEASGLAIDGNGTLYVADTANHTIRKITPAGVVTTLAGTPGAAGGADGTGAAARFDRPVGVAVDGGGNVYVSEQFGRVIRRITPAGVVTTLAGARNAAGATDGTGSAARFTTPGGLGVDAAGNVFVVDSGTHTLRRITPTGVVTTVGGTADSAGATNGPGAAARFNTPEAVTVDRNGTIFVADTFNHAIRRGAALPALSSADIATAFVSQPFTYIVTFNGAQAGTVQVSDLPAGFAFNATTGVISGTPTAAGSFAVGLRATNSAGTGTATLTLNVNGAPVITSQPRDLAVDIGQAVTFRLSVSGLPAPVIQWRKNGIAIAGATGPSLTIPSASTLDSGQYSAFVQNDLGNVSSRIATLTVIRGFPTITTRLPDRALAEGGGATFSHTTAGDAPFTYQWFRDGVAVPGATSATLVLQNATSAEAGAYTLAATNAVGTGTSEPTIVSVSAASALANLSVRTALPAGQTLFVGAVVRDGAKNLLVRAAGPALGAFGLTGVADPRIELYSGPTLVAANDDWAPALAATFAGLGAFPFNPGSRDAALQQSLSGAVTFQARGTGPGTVLVEAYDAEGGLSPRLANLSARSRVGTGADILIAGFNISGTGAKQALIRAVGPGLAALNVTGFLADPTLTVVNANTGAVIASNNDWSSTLAPTFTRVGAFPLTNGSRDAALLVTLPAGASYTVQVAGADGGTGEAIVEIYEVF